jgi:tetratricopeptide (TPR) repeat protein
MNQSTFFFKYRGFILLLAIVIISAIVVFYFTNASKNEASNVKDDQIPPTSTSVPPPASTVSSSSPLSPVSIIATVILNPEVVDSQFEMGMQLYQNGEYESAKEVFDDIIASDPNNVASYDARGSVYTALGDYENALNDYSQAIGLDASFPYAYYNRGRVYSLLKRDEEALSDLQRSAELGTYLLGYQAYGNIGLIYHRQGKYNQALEAFEESIFYDDTKADVFYLRGETYTVLEDHEAAIADYQAAITRFSNYDTAYQSLGYAYYKTGQFDQAFEALNQALEISPNSPTAHLYLALVYVAKNDFEEARTEASQVMDSIATLSAEEQQLILTRVLADLETFAEKNPAKAIEVEALINSIPEPK